MEIEKDLIKGFKINSKGFGFFSKLVIRDPSISYQAKAIYCYICSLAGCNNSVLVSKNTMQKELGMSKETLQKYISELIDKGLIKVEQSKNNNGEFSPNIYTLLDEII